MSGDSPEFVDVPFDGLEPERLVPTLPGLGLGLSLGLQPVAGTGATLAERDCVPGRPRSAASDTNVPLTCNNALPTLPL